MQDSISIIDTVLFFITDNEIETDINKTLRFP